ncbi:MAG: hypothetical protein HYY22_07795 [Thaumarchaeota archaeon]|nr:hypothetical protein [Nitrososphaerota archaeon]
MAPKSTVLMDRDVLNARLDALELKALRILAKIDEITSHSQTKQEVA